MTRKGPRGDPYPSRERRLGEEPFLSYVVSVHLWDFPILFDVTTSAGQELEMVVHAALSQPGFLAISPPRLPDSSSIVVMIFVLEARPRWTFLMPVLRHVV